MRWASGPGAEFTSPTVVPWLPIGPNVDGVNVASEANDPASMLHLTRRLLACRKQYLALSVGSFRSIYSDAQCFVYERSLDSQCLVVALDLTGTDAYVNLPEAISGEVLVSTEVETEASMRTGVVRLRSNQGAMFLVS
jgi:glycosidase